MRSQQRRNAFLIKKNQKQQYFGAKKGKSFAGKQLLQYAANSGRRKKHIIAPGAQRAPQGVYLFACHRRGILPKGKSELKTPSLQFACCGRKGACLAAFKSAQLLASAAIQTAYGALITSPAPAEKPLSVLAEP
jgi:hypothetical protein